MTEAQIKVVFDNGIVDAPTGFNFEDFSNINDIEAQKLYSAELDPPIPLCENETEILNHVHFEDFYVMPTKIRFFVPKKFDVRIPESIKCLTLKIVKPGNINTLNFEL